MGKQEEKGKHPGKHFSKTQFLFRSKKGKSFIVNRGHEP
jgi:hypothetical protein